MLSLSFFKIFVLAIGLSLDAFIASAALGSAVHRDRWSHSLKLALYISFFHGTMPILGWIAGRNFFSVIQPYDHWIAFILLTLLGIKLYREEVDEECSPAVFKL